ncbi:phage head-tail joining protein [Mesorhizobium huakuii]|uniref:Phage tail protein n=1 Tax=Mesorhizobium huakuii TaxID=28104 RepID=A0ABZ0VVA9_9HYPH|nr:hypothetical protein [Mesorhizobium huakuii]WQB99541.1 hypothetical protein U0R22_003722 [Mesorhizobium huakuii]
MATLPDLVAKREKLLDAVYSGVRTVRDANGEEITYRSQSELKAALVSLNREIQVRESELGCSRIVYPSMSKGL